MHGTSKIALSHQHKVIHMKMHFDPTITEDRSSKLLECNIYKVLMCKRQIMLKNNGLLRVTETKFMICEIEHTNCSKLVTNKMSCPITLVDPWFDQ